MTDKVEVDRADLEALLKAWEDDGTHGLFNGPLERLTKLLAPPQDSEHDRLVSERDSWKQAALHFMTIAADGVLRLKTGTSYDDAQRKYNEALEVYEKAKAFGKSEDRP